MAQQKGQAEINNFVGGLITDASPLTFPENTSKTDINMDLLTDGSRKRALGIDYEPSYQIISTSVTNAGTESVGVKAYRWENVGGDAEVNILCVQTGNEVKFFLLEGATVSTGYISGLTFAGDPSKKYSFTSVDGELVVADGTSPITIVSYANGVISSRTSIIKIRDLFGVEDVVSGTDLTSGLGLTKWPRTFTQAHAYNLRNQGFGIPRRDTQNPGTLVDPIAEFANIHNSLKGYIAYPSNSDAIAPYLYPDANISADRFTNRYYARDAISNPVGTTRAAQGYYTIELFNRGASRLNENSFNHVNYPELGFGVYALPTDRTPGGASVVAEFAGRVWYGGFSGDVIDGDSKSPKLSSYVAFSQLVNESSQITQCYQAGDPTSTTAPDLLDTDGGLIRISNLYDIKAMINLGSDLMIGASNGWWRIYGGNDSGFSGTNYVVSKITDRGVSGESSIVEAEGTILYWADDGIYHIKKDQFGSWVCESITTKRIQTFYDDLSVNSKRNVVGCYDSYQKKVRWLYQNTLNSSQQQKELVFSLSLGAFWERHISQPISSGVPILAFSYTANPFRVNDVAEPVTVGGVVVTSQSETVTVTIGGASLDSTFNEIGYLIITRVTSTLQYTFGFYRDSTFVDWKSVDGVGVDAPSTLVTGTSSGGDNIRYKQMPYIVVHMNRTEDGFEENDEGDFVPTNQSGCLLQVQWDWTNSANANKWSTPIQVYRYRRHYFPSGVDDDFDTGYETIVTRNKLRGRGRALTLKFQSEEGKEMHIYGWSFTLLGNSSE